MFRQPHQLPGFKLGQSLYYVYQSYEINTLIFNIIEITNFAKLY